MSTLSPVKSFVKLVTTPSFRARLKETAYRLRHSRWKGLSMRLNYPDRVFLEDQIFPYLLNQADIHRILFIGCEWFTSAYPFIFKSREFWTIEIDPTKARYGSGGKHITDSLERLSKHFKPDYFDLIIHNGVFGWGINTRELTQKTFEECHICLRPDGMMIFGWDDVPEHRSFPVIEECEALGKFRAIEFPPVGSHQYLTADDSLRHTFNFFRKASALR